MIKISWSYRKSALLFGIAVLGSSVILVLDTGI